MATVGTAYVVVRAITSQVENDIKNGLQKGVDAAAKAGDDAGRRFDKNFNRGGGGRGGMFGKLAEDAERARLTLRRLTITNYFVTPAVTGLVGAIGSLVAALGPLATILSRASQSAVVLGSSLSAILQGAIVAKVGIGGVADAIKAGIKAKDEEVDGNKRIEDALKRVEQARIRLRNIIDKEAPERLAAAREAAARAEDAAADAIINAERSLRSYNRAQENTLEALEGLNEARERAKERIQQLRFELEGGAISERRARLEFEKARDALQRVQDLPPDSRARQEAELAFAQADLNLRKAIDRNKDLQKEEAAATKAGVEGSDEVVSAKRRIEDAIVAEKDAQIAAAKAQLEVSRAREAADKAAAAAAEGGSVQREIDEQIAQAREALKDALEDLKEVEKGSGSAGKQFKDAMEKISPAARVFVETFMKVREEFRRLRFAASETLFPGVTRSLNIVVDNIGRLEPLFASTGRVLGFVAEQFTRTVFEGENFGRLRRVWQTNNGLIRNFGTAMSNVYTAVLAVLDAARPLAKQFGGFIERITGNWAQSATSNTDALTERFEFAGKTAARIGGIFRDLWEAFSGIGVASVEGGAFETLLGYFEQSAEGFRTFVESGEVGDKSLGEFLNTAAENAGKVLTALADIVKIFLRLGGEEGTGQFAESISKAAKNFEETLKIVSEGENGLGQFIEKLSELFLKLAESESFGKFFGVLNDAIDAVIRFIEIPFVKENLDTIFSVFALVKAFGLLTRVGKFLGLGVLGNIIKPFSLVGGAFNGLATGLAKVARGREVSRWKEFTGTLRSMAINTRTILARWAGNVKNFWGSIKSVFSSIGTALKTFGSKLATAFKTILTVVRSFVTSLFKVLAANPWILLVVALIAIVILVVKNLDKIKEFFARAMAAIVTTFVNFKDRAVEIFANFVASIVNFFHQIRDFIVKYHPYAILFRAVRDAWPEIRDWFGETVEKIIGWFRGMKDRLSGVWTNFWDGLKNGFKDALNFLIRKWNDFKITARIPSNKVTRGLGLAGAGFDFETPNIPLLADGGIIPARRGGTLALIGEAGRSERVEPLDSDGLSQRDKAMIKYITSAMGGGAGGTTINVYPSPGMDERELAEMVSRKLAYQMRVGAI